jgi:RNA-directed DNA polymerase
MNRFLKYWRITGRSEVFQAQVVNYADDFVILSRRCATEALNWTRRVMPRIGLTLNEAKTSIKQARTERFDFLGYTFGPHRIRKTGRVFLGESPSKKSVARLRQKVGDLLTPSNVSPWLEVRDRLNAVLRGWSNYFSCGDRYQAYRAVDHHVYDNVRRFMRRRHKVSSLGTSRFSDNVVFGKLGVLRLRDVFWASLPCTGW